MSDNTPKTEENPFEGFKSEAFDRGEPIEVEEPKAAEPEAKVKDEAPATQESAPKPAAEDGEQPTTAEKDDDAAPKPEKQKTAQERINEITRARREAERKVEAEQRRADAAEARARELEARLAAPPKEEPIKGAAAEDDPDAPNPNDEKYEYGELDSRYIRDLARHEANKAFSEQRQQDEQTREQRAREEKQTAARGQFEVMVERGSKVHKDFYEKVVIGAEKLEWPMSETMGEMALASEVGNDVLYHLATNPQEADRVYRSSPVEQARYFGRMEAKFSAEQTAAPGTEPGKPAPKLPKAPAPVEPARGAGGQFQATADTDDFLAFEKRVNSGS